MTPLGLTSWFRRRMLLLVVAASLAAAAAPPLAYFFQKRRELDATARGDAARVAVALTEVVQQRPTLWRYDTSKLVERLSFEGLDRLPALVVHDARGALVLMHPKGGAARAGRLFWARAEVVVGSESIASVWVAVDGAPLALGTLGIGLLSALLSSLLGAVLYLVPVRTIARAERRILGLMGQLALALQEEERGRIARDLHDGAGQALTAARLHLLALRRSAGHGSQARIDDIAQHLDEALDEVRRSTAALMPPALAELGLPGALARHCEAFASAAGLEVVCEATGPLPGLEAHVETACYRIVQEALTNTARHAGATRAWVRLSVARGSLELCVDDDGQGLTLPPGQGSGIESIQERARLLGGAAVFSSEGSGTRLRVTLPCPGGRP